MLRVHEDDPDDPKLIIAVRSRTAASSMASSCSPPEGGPYTPCTLYHVSRNSGVGKAISVNPRRAQGPLSIGMCGLGTGTVAAYTQPGDTLRFYEIDPNVIALSRGEHPWFRYLADAYVARSMSSSAMRASRSNGSSRRRARNGFDVLAIAAFSGDAIPSAPAHEARPSRST